MWSILSLKNRPALHHTRLTITVYLYTLSSMDIHNTSEIDTASKKKLLVKETGWWLVIGSRVSRDGRSSGDEGSMKGRMKAHRNALSTQHTYRQEQGGIECSVLDSGVYESVKGLMVLVPLSPSGQAAQGYSGVGAGGC